MSVNESGLIRLSVGKRLPRKDGWSKVNGQTPYVEDLQFADMVYVAVKRSEHAHARIDEIKIDRNLLADLGATVYTAVDIPGKNVIHIIFDDWPLLADQVVRHYGEPIAVVLAETPLNAKKALDAIDVVYKPLKPTLTPLDARQNKDVHIYGEDNVFSRNYHKGGNTDQGLEECDVVVTEEYHTPAQEHAYLENQGSIAVPDPDNRITLYSSCQCPFYIQRAVADILALPFANVRVIQTTTGGAFGGKEDVPSQVAGLAALGAYLTKRPAQLVYDREEDVHTTSKRHPAVVRVTSGATKDGLLHAWKSDFYFNSGAYATIGPAVLYRGAIHAVGPYRCPNVDVVGELVATNLVPFGAFRGFGSPQVIFAGEEQVDRLAHALEMDPAEFRRKNIVRQGDTTSFGQHLDHSVGALETLERALEKSGWASKWKKPPTREELVRHHKQGTDTLSGIGLSSIFYGVGLGSAGKHMSRSGAYVQIHADGSVLFAVGTTEMGQGMITVLSQIVADALGVPYESVQMTPTDTSRVPDSGPTVASRGTTFPGRALLNACKNLTDRLITIAAREMDVTNEELELADYAVRMKDEPEKKLEVSELIRTAAQQRVNLAATGWEVAPHTDYNNSEGQGIAYIVYAFATNVVELDVDISTGEVTVKRIVAAHDLGKAINPQTAEGQIEGGTAQGLGYGRFEEIKWDKEGKIITENLSTYIMPSSHEAPEIVPIIVEDPYKEGPFGAKGFAEQPLMGIAPAITNAIFNATGVRLSEIPATPERVWKAIQLALKEVQE